MDKLKTDLYGGFPFELDDWRWEIDAHRAALSGLLTGIQRAGHGGLIASGLEVTLNTMGGVTAVSPGWVIWDGEMFYFPGGQGNSALGPNLHFLAQDIINDPGGMEVFEDGTIQDTYEQRRLKLVATGIDYWTTADAEQYMSVGRVSRMQDQLWPQPWVSVTDYLGDWSAPSGLQVRLEPGGIVRVKGTVVYSGSPTGAIGTLGMFILPPGYRPNGSVMMSAAMFPYSDAPRVVQVAPNGVVAVSAIQSGVGPGTKVYLTDLSFTIA